MVKFKNRFGGVMYVDDSRVSEYEALGYKRFAEAKPKEEIKEEQKPTKKVTKKK